MSVTLTNEFGFLSRFIMVGRFSGTSSLRFRATLLDGEYVSVTRLATSKEWFYGGFSYPAWYSIKLFPSVVFVTLNVMYYNYSIACIHQLADCALLNKLFHFECSC